MAKAKVKAKKKKASEKMKPKKRAIARAKSVKRVSKASNRRKHRRYAAKNLWVTEYAGDYKFVSSAANISEGGVFLQGRLTNSRSPSMLIIKAGGETITLSATPVRDMVSASTCGTGYAFSEVSAAQARALKNLLRNLD